MVTQTITRDLSDINARVKEAATDLRRERVRLISERVKQVSAPGLGGEVDVALNSGHCNPVYFLYCKSGLFLNPQSEKRHLMTIEIKSYLLIVSLVLNILAYLS